MNFLLRRVGIFIVCFSFLNACRAQFLMDMPDSSRQISITGYIQPQFQYIQEKGAKTYSGGDFPPHANNRMMLRRGRVRLDYAFFGKQDKPQAYFVFQFDGTERGVFIRDFWGRAFENKWNLFSFTAGMFARPFGYELNLSSSDRETPERGRMSQILMRTERDLGAMVSFSPRTVDHPLHLFKFDAGFFNGQGLTAFNDFDSYKDFIARATVKSYRFSSFELSAGLSYFNGGFFQNSKYIYRIQAVNGIHAFQVDSSLSNIGKKAPRKYYGADAQVKWIHSSGFTELRGEYWQGKQTALASTSETPGNLPDEPYYIRNFNGAYLYLLHRYKNHQAGMKYDWYDPNTNVSKYQVGKAGANVNATNISYHTLGFGYINYINESLKLVLWYEIVKNEKTLLPGFSEDVRDNVLTCRLQFRF